MILKETVIKIKRLFTQTSAQALIFLAKGRGRSLDNFVNSVKFYRIHQE